MKLQELLKNIKPTQTIGDVEVEITGVNIDSRKIKDGHLFVAMKGTQVNDIFMPDSKEAGQEVPNLHTKTNHSGGIQGGISNGEDISFRVAFKPVATLLMEQQTVDIHGQATTLTARGRHDPCVLPRAVPVVESMAAITILDYYLLNKSSKI